MTRAADLARRARELDEQGATVAEIAAELGISEARVDKLLDPLAPDHGLPVPLRLIDPDSREGVITSQVPVSFAEVKRVANLPAGPKRKAKPGRRMPREHGTKRGYAQHRWRKESVCRPCLDAYNAHMREKKAQAS